MNVALSLLGIAGALVVGAMSPGPSFVVVARTAVASSRADGLGAAVGMGVGGVIFSIAALLGLQALLAAVPGLYFIVKLVGGGYLVYLGVRIWRGAKQPLQVIEATETRTTRHLVRAFGLGLGTQISNPKTAVVYASVFAALLPREVPLSLALSIPVVIFFIEAGWYSVVALALSSAGPRAAYLRYKIRVDRAAGGVMVLLGVRLLSASRDA